MLIFGVIADSCGAVNTQSSLERFCIKICWKSVAPPSTMTFVASNWVTRYRNRGANSSVPPALGRARRVCEENAEVSASCACARSVGASSLSTLESRGVRNVGSTMTRKGVRKFVAPRTVSVGLSATTVPTPTTMASTQPRSSWTSCWLSLQLIQLESL